MNRQNHLAAAICNELLLRGKSVLIITVADIMSAMKDTFRNSGTSEEQLLNDLSNVDLLVIDGSACRPNRNTKK